MHIRFWCMLLFAFVIFCFQTSYALRQLRLPTSRRFLLLRTNTINQRACTCSTSFSCSCCETVTLIFSKMRKALCSNFMYQRNGMNVDVSLNTDTLRSTTITNYRPFKVCTAIPGSIFSSICVNVLELNEFSRSITVCVRHEILSKFEEWQINYTCVSISTTLPMIAVNATMANIMSTSTSGMPSMGSAPMMASSASMAPQASTMSQMMASTAAAPMMTSPAGMMMMMMMAPNGTGGSPPGQMGAMGGGGAAGGGSPAGGPPGGGPPGGGPSPQMMSMQGRRKKRYTKNKPLLNRWSKIVNDRFGTPPLVSEGSIKPTPTDIPNISTIVDTEVSIFRDITIDYNPGTPGPAALILHDRAAYFPSRIPPMVAMTLKEESIINPVRDDILFTTDNNSQLSKNKMGNLIFPN